jgi:integrase
MTAKVARSARIPMLAISQNPDRVSNILRTSVVTIRFSGIPRWGLTDKGTKGKRARVVPLIAEVRDVVQRRMDDGRERPDGRLFTGPRGGRIATAVLRDAEPVKISV